MNELGIHTHTLIATSAIQLINEGLPQLALPHPNYFTIIMKH